MAELPLRDHIDLRVASSDVPGDIGVLPAEASILQARTVHRAVADFRRGTPVLLDGSLPLVAVPAETVSARGLRELEALCEAPAMLLLAPSRAAAILRRPVAHGAALDHAAVAIRAQPGLFDPAILRAAADPTAEQLLPDSFDLLATPPLGTTALALAKLARLLPAVVAAPARPGARALASSLSLATVPAADVLGYPATAAAELVKVATAAVPLEGAPDARVVAFRAPDMGVEHLAILIGRPDGAPSEASSAAEGSRHGGVPLVRIHSECFTGDLLGSLRCDCGPQLRGAIARIAREGCGAVLYLAQEGRGIGLVNKLRAYALQDRGLDTVDANRALGWGADERNFLVAATMLNQLGIPAVRLLTNNPDKVAALAACGVSVVAREPLVIPPNGVDDQYLAAKAARLGHYLG